MAPENFLPTSEKRGKLAVEPKVAVAHMAAAGSGEGNRDGYRTNTSSKRQNKTELVNDASSSHFLGSGPVGDDDLWYHHIL